MVLVFGEAFVRLPYPRTQLVMLCRMATCDEVRVFISELLEARWHNLRVLYTLLCHGLLLFLYHTLMYSNQARPRATNTAMDL